MSVLGHEAALVQRWADARCPQSRSSCARRFIATLTRTVRGLVSELALTAEDDGVPTDCVVNFDNIHTIPRDTIRRFVEQLDARRMGQACQRPGVARGRSRPPPGASTDVAALGDVRAR